MSHVAGTVSPWISGSITSRVSWTEVISGIVGSVSSGMHVAGTISPWISGTEIVVRIPWTVSAVVAVNVSGIVGTVAAVVAWIGRTVPAMIAWVGRRRWAARRRWCAGGLRAASATSAAAVMARSVWT